MKHPAEETLGRVGRGEGSPTENRKVVAHLLRGCKICSEIVREAIQPETPSVRGRVAVRSARVTRVVGGGPGTYSG
jgi:predicted Rossmann-fold nucleotide-binding protein